MAMMKAQPTMKESKMGGRRTLFNENTSRVRGMHSDQWVYLGSKLREQRSQVCRTREEIPFLDFLDLIYEPAAKAHWLENYRYFGGKWVAYAGGTAPAISHHLEFCVTPARDKAYNVLKIHFGGNGGSAYWKPFFPAIGGENLSRNLVFSPLDMLDDNGVPERIRHLHAKYGRHIVRCARENAVFNIAMEKTEHLFKEAKCARMIKYFFPEIIEHVPNGEYNYWKKTKENTWASKYKEDKKVLENMAAALGPNWDTLKNHIMGIIARSLVVEAVSKESIRPTYVLSYDEQKWYEHGGKPMEEWLVRVSFNP